MGAEGLDACELGGKTEVPCKKEDTPLASAREERGDVGGAGVGLIDDFERRYPHAGVNICG